MSDRDPVYRLRDLQKLQLLEALHSFAFNARKALELADVVTPGIIARAQKLMLAPPTELATKDLVEDVGAATHTPESLWFVLGRVIHSQHIEVADAEDVEVGSAWAAAPKTTSYWTPLVFAVRSDRDPPEGIHYVEPKRLVAAFLALRDDFHDATLAAD